MSCIEKKEAKRQFKLFYLIIWIFQENEQTFTIRVIVSNIVSVCPWFGCIWLFIFRGTEKRIDFGCVGFDVHDGRW